MCVNIIKIVKWFASPMSDGILYPMPRIAIVIGCIALLWIDNSLLERI